MKKLLVLAALLAALFALLYQLPMFHAPVQVAEAPAARQPEAPQEAPSPAASEPAEQTAAAPVEEVHESPDAATTLERILPRASVGHAQGLNKTEDKLGLKASSVLVVDAQTREQVHAKNPDAVLPIASITKLMTALVLLDMRLPMDHAITITEDDVDRQRSSRSRLRVGSVLTRSEALRLALMSSENRASHALARTAPQGLGSFVLAMNRKAKQLGMTNTQFVDPTGLSERNQSTANDLSRLVLAASGYPLVREYSTTEAHIQPVGERMLQYRNSDALVKEGTWDISLQKTGYIIEAGHSVVLRTRLAGRDLVMVILDADGNRTRTADAHRIRRHLDPEGEARAVAAARDAANRRAAQAKAEAKKQQQIAQAQAQKKKKKAEANPKAGGQQSKVASERKKKSES